LSDSPNPACSHRESLPQSVNLHYIHSSIFILQLSRDMLRLLAATTCSLDGGACDILSAAGDPCVPAHSTTRALVAGQSLHSHQHSLLKLSCNTRSHQQHATGLDTVNCGKNTDLSTHFPSFSVDAAQAATLHQLSWKGGVVEDTTACTGLGNLGQTGLDCGELNPLLSLSFLPSRAHLGAAGWTR
jgi:hypothetical protein